MLFISIDDFYKKAKGLKKLSREEEKSYATKMVEGDADAYTKIMQNYLPMVAFRIWCAPKNVQTLDTVYRCLGILEQAINKFDFQQDSESFTHYLSWRLRRCITRCMVERRHEGL